MVKYIHVISASDSSSGAGMQQDVLTCSKLGIWPICSVTGITAQTFEGVISTESSSVPIFKQQLQCSKKFAISAIKIGAILDFEILQLIKSYILDMPGIPVIIDPVLRPTGGDDFYSEQMFDYFKDELLALATLITPNRGELQKICDIEYSALKEAALYIQNRYAGKPAFYLKGGHFTGQKCVEYLVTDTIRELQKERWNIRYTHGTGCAMSTAVACFMAQRYELEQAAFKGSNFVTTYYEELNKIMTEKGR